MLRTPTGLMGINSQHGERPKLPALPLYLLGIKGEMRLVSRPSSYRQTASDQLMGVAIPMQRTSEPVPWRLTHSSTFDYLPTLRWTLGPLYQSERWATRFSGR